MAVGAQGPGIEEDESAELPIGQPESRELPGVGFADRLDLEPLGPGRPPEVVEPRAVGVDLGRSLVGGDGPADIGVGPVGALFGIERAGAEDLLEQAGVSRILDGPDQALRVGHVLLERIEERPHGLLGQRIAQDLARRPAVPEQAADELSVGVAVELGPPAGVGRSRRLAVAEPALYRPLVDAAFLVQLLARPGVADRRPVTRPRNPAPPERRGSCRRRASCRAPPAA